jgi:CHASE2 domain-containing sensor protein
VCLPPELLGTVEFWPKPVSHCAANRSRNNFLGMGWAARVFDPLRRLSRRFWVTFALACVVAEGGELLFERLIRSGNSDVAGSVLVLSGLYQRLATSARTPEVRRTVMVEIDPRVEFEEISAANVCAEREFLSRLLARVDQAEPALIVVDKWFGKTTCSPADQGTAHLIKVVKGLRHKLVVGVRATELTLPPGPGSPTSFLNGSLDLGLDASQQGLVNIADDSRRLPLQWSVYSEDNPRSAVIVKDTLSLAAALAFDPGLRTKDARLDQLIVAGQQPYIGFLGAAQWKEANAHFYASEILCGARAAPRGDWEICQGPSLPPVPKALTHQIVLIGESAPDSDTHHSVVGAVEGMYLQANYIEALLDSQFLKPASVLWDYGAGFCFLLLLELILIVWHNHLGPTVVSVIGLLLVSYCVLYFTALLAGYYIDPVPVGASGVIIKILHSAFGEPPNHGPAKRTAAPRGVGGQPR